MPRHFRMTLVVLFLLCLFCLIQSAYPLRHQPIALAQGGEVATITGRVTNNTGNALAGVSVVLVDPDDPATRTPSAVTNFDGDYTVTQPISKTWIIYFEPNFDPDFNYNYYVPEYYNDAFDINDATLVTAEVGTTTANINAGLSSVNEISGRVTADADDAPIADVYVTAFDAKEGYEHSYAYSDATGYFTLTYTSDNGAKLRFDPPDTSSYALEYYNDHDSLHGSTIVKVPAGRDVRLEVGLGTGAVITGMVRSSWLDRPLQAPAVYAYNESGEQIQVGGRFGDSITNFDPLYPPGYYAIHNLPPGSYRLLFQASAHRSFNRQSFINVSEGGKVTDINAKLIIDPDVNSIATSAGAPNTIFMVFGYDVVPVLTTDGGMQWHTIPNPSWINDREPWIYPDYPRYSMITTGLAPRGAPGEGTRLLVNVDYASDRPDAVDPGTYRSGDDGATWADAPIDPPINTDSCSSYFYTTPETTVRAPHRLYMLQKCYYTESIRLLVSDNGGVTWRDVTTRDGRTLLLFFEAKIVVSPATDGLVFVHDGREQWYRSRNGGLDWETVSFPVQSITLDAEDPNTLYGWSHLTGSPTTRPPKRSTDGGATWQDWADNPCPYSFNFEPPQLVAHPTVGKFLMVRCDNELTNGIYRSLDGGDKWQKIANSIGVLIVADLGVPGRFLWAKEDGLWAITAESDVWQPIMQNYRLDSTMLYIPNVAGAP